MPHYLWQEYNWLRVTAQCAVSVYACVYVPPLLWSSNAACEWDPNVAPQNRKQPFLSLRHGCALRGLHVVSWIACEKPDLAPCFSPSFQHTWLLSVDKTSGKVKGHVISIIMFLLRKYLYQGLPSSFSASTAEYFNALRPEKCPSQGFFPFVSRWRLLVWIMVVGGGSSLSWLKGTIFKQSV